MTKSWSVPFPESETEHDGMPVFWRFQATVEEDGIKIFALQYILFIRQSIMHGWFLRIGLLILNQRQISGYRNGNKGEIDMQLRK